MRSVISALFVLLTLMALPSCNRPDLGVVRSGLDSVQTDLLQVQHGLDDLLNEFEDVSPPSRFTATESLRELSQRVEKIRGNLSRHAAGLREQR